MTRVHVFRVPRETEIEHGLPCFVPKYICRISVARSLVEAPPRGSAQNGTQPLLPPSFKLLHQIV